MVPQLHGPVVKGFALGSGHDVRLLAAVTPTLPRFAVSLIAAIVAIAIACHDAEPPGRSACGGEPVRMGVASSLREVADGLRKDLAADASPIATETIFGASSVLARQIELGAPMDLIVSADQDIVERLAERGLVDAASVREIARGGLVLLAREGFADAADARTALGSDALRRIALPARAVPLGRYARTWLDAERALPSLGSRIVITEHARATLAAVDGGVVDLAVVYASDARLAVHARVVERIDADAHPPIRYVAARVSAAKACPAVDRALAAWTTRNARARLAALGFGAAAMDASP